MCDFSESELFDLFGPALLLDLTPHASRSPTDSSTSDEIPRVNTLPRTVGIQHSSTIDAAASVADDETWVRDAVDGYFWDNLRP